MDGFIFGIGIAAIIAVLLGVFYLGFRFGVLSGKAYLVKAIEDGVLVDADGLRWRIDPIGRRRKEGRS